MPFYKWAVDKSAQTFSQRRHFEQSIQGRQNPPSKYGLYTNEKKTPHTNFVGKSDYAHLRNVLGKYNAVKQRHDFSGDCTSQLQSNH